MLLRRSFQLGIVSGVIILAGLAFSCSSKEKSVGGPAEKTGSAGSSGTGVGGSSGGAGSPQLMGGNAGSAGSAGAGGTAGSAGGAPNTFIPDWQTVASHETCSVQALANSQEAIAFKWEPCEGVSNCERARTSSGNFLGKTDLFASDSRITEFNGKVTVAVVAVNEKGYALFATEDGRVNQVFRTQYPGNGITCSLPHVDAYQGRLQVDVSHRVNGDQHWDRFIGTLESNSLSPSNPDYSNLKLPSGQLVGIPGASDIISTKHQFFVSHGFTTLTSMEFGKPETLKLLYHPEISSLGASAVQRHGDRIAYTARFAAGTGGKRTTYYISDGDSQGKVYLASTDEVDVGSLRFADSHVAWLQGKYSTNGSQNRSDVEIWTSKIAKGSDQLEPALVAKLPAFGSVYGAAFGAEGGFGKYVIPAASKEGGGRVQVWDLARKTKKEYQAPGGAAVRAIKGITQEFLWLTIYDQNSSDSENEYLVRYRLNESK